MTRTEEALLAAVTADPHDDLPRLAYADFCEEQGDAARGEFIRVQAEVARLGGLARDRGRRDDIGLGWALPPRERADLERLWTRAADLLRANAAAWTPDPFAALDGFVFRRGFVAEVTLPCDAWVAHGPALVRAAPLERVTLADKRPFMKGWERYGGPTPLSWHVPGPVYRLLRGRSSEGQKCYRDDAAALEALSGAALAWAAAVAAPPGAGV